MDGSLDTVAVKTDELIRDTVNEFARTGDRPRDADKQTNGRSKRRTGAKTRRKDTRAKAFTGKTPSLFEKNRGNSIHYFTFNTFSLEKHSATIVSFKTTAQRATVAFLNISPNPTLTHKEKSRNTH